MKLKIKTLKLQEMLSKAVKGASCNKMIPITELLAISVSDSSLCLITSDATNYLYVMDKVSATEDFYVVVKIDQFYKLISRMTCDEIILEIVDGNLSVKGNGKYMIELPLNEEGNPIKYPNPLDDITCDNSFSEIKASTIRVLLESNKSALASTEVTPCFSGYYVADRVVTTDGYIMCGTNIKIFDEAVMFSSELMDLIGIIDTEDIKVYKVDDNTFVFNTPTISVYGQTLPYVDDFPIEPIEKLLDAEYEHQCTVSKNELLNVLDRLSLFVSPYDKKRIQLTFSKEGMIISSKKTDGVETVGYIDSQNFTDFACAIDIEMLKSQVKSHATDGITILYGAPNSIKIVEGNVVQVIGLIEE